MENRRKFLKKALGASVATSIGVVATNAFADNKAYLPSDLGNGVVQGHSTKKEVLYHKSRVWEQYYKIAY